MNLLNLLDRLGTWLVIQLHWVGQWFGQWCRPLDNRWKSPFYDETGRYRPGCSDYRPGCPDRYDF
jgi:hypothetical protein